MPELAELKIMSDYINQNVKDKTFTKLYHVEKGNIPVDSNLIEKFKLEADSNGKELVLKLYNDNVDISISVLWVCLVIGFLHQQKLGLIESSLE
jgi:hypothetical protein